MTTSLQDRLRKVCSEIRRKPTPLSDLIPLLQEAADKIDYLEEDLIITRKIRNE
jgi:hypothetical protein